MQNSNGWRSLFSQIVPNKSGKWNAVLYCKMYDKYWLILPLEHVSLERRLWMHCYQTHSHTNRREEWIRLNHVNMVLSPAHLEWEQHWMKIGITLAFWRVRETVPAAGWQFVTSGLSWTINLITPVHCTLAPWESNPNSMEMVKTPHSQMLHYQYTSKYASYIFE